MCILLVAVTIASSLGRVPIAMAANAVNDVKPFNIDVPISTFRQQKYANRDQ